MRAPAQLDLAEHTQPRRGLELSRLRGGAWSMGPMPDQLLDQDLTRDETVEQPDDSREGEEDHKP
jgi:hypothetical protein